MGSIGLQVLQLFFLVGLGYLIRKLGVIDRPVVKGLSSLLTRVTLPALAFVSLLRTFSPELFRESLLFLVAAFGVYLFYGIVAFSSARFWGKDARQSGVFQFLIMFGNVGFMGFPILETVLGPSSLFYAAIFNIPFFLCLFTFGVYFLSRGHKSLSVKQILKLLLSPGIIATLAGFLCFVLSIKLPELILNPIKSVGGLTTPLSMIVVGALLADVNPRELFSGWRVYFGSALRLFILPALIGLVFILLRMKPMFIQIAVLLTAMPVAANAPLMSHEYGADESLASRLVFITTLFSLLSLPLMMALLSYIIPFS